jgi:hypothetical protein
MKRLPSGDIRTEDCLSASLKIPSVFPGLLTLLRGQPNRSRN